MAKGVRFLFIILLFFELLFGNSHLYSQESLNASGGNASGTGGTVSFSIGQVVFKTFSAKDFSVSQGVQQPYEISVLTESGALPGINLMVSAFPNPATDYLILKFSEGDYKGHIYMLIDKSGKLLREGEITDYDTLISLKGLGSATYFIKVIKDQQERKTFKIVKI